MFSSILSGVPEYVLCVHKFRALSDGQFVNSERFALGAFRAHTGRSGRGTIERTPHSDHFAHPSRDGYAVFMLSIHVIIKIGDCNCAAGNNLITLFCQCLLTPAIFNWC